MAVVSDKSSDEKVTDDDVDKLAGFMTTWEKMLGPLGLDRAKEKEIEAVKGYAKQKKECVEEWREKAGDKATYRAFITAARKVELNRLADSVMSMLRERETSAVGKFNVWYNSTWAHTNTYIEANS